MNNINAKHTTNYFVQNLFFKTKEQDNLKFDEKNLNEQIPYKGVDARYFNSQKYAIKRQKLGYNNISFKAIMRYKSIKYKLSDYTNNDKIIFNEIFKNIFNSFKNFFASRGLRVADANLDTLCNISFVELEKSWKNFENEIEYDDSFEQVKERKNESLKQKKNIISKKIDVLKKDKIAKNIELFQFKDSIENEISTESFMMNKFACLSLFAGSHPKILTVHDNLCKILILDYMRQNKNIFQLNSILGSTNLLINTEHILCNQLFNYIYVFDDIDSDMDNAKKMFKSASNFVANYLATTIINVKIKLISNAIIKIQEQLAKLEYKEPEISDEERNKLLNEILFEENQNSIEIKAQKAKSVTKKNRKKQTKSQTQNIDKRQNVSQKKDNNNMTITQTYLDKPFVKVQGCLDIVDRSEIGKEKFSLNDKIIDLKSKYIKQEIRYIDDIEHEYNIASEELTDFFFKKLISSDKLNEQVSEKVGDKVLYSNHFVGSFLYRFQEENKEATLDDCVNACIEILNDGAILHSSTQIDKTKLELYLPKYKMTIPFNLNYDTNKIYFKTMFIQKDIENCRRAVQNPKNKNIHTYSFLSGMHAYLTQEKSPQYYTLNDSYETIKKLQERIYSI